MSKWIICVAVSSMVGTILYGIWYLFSTHVDKRKYLAFIYVSLHILTVFFSLLAFVGIIASIYLTTIPLDSFWGITNARVEYPAMVMGGVWVIGAIWRLGQYVHWHLLHGKLIRSLELVELNIHRIGMYVGSVLDIKPAVKIMTGQPLFTAELAGWRKPVILLPDYDYTEQQIVNIITHELVHYRNQDRIVRELAILLHCVHWFNPVVKCLHRSLERWDELYCDSCVCEQDFIKKEDYAETLLYMSEQLVKKREAFMAIAFSERGSDMIERLKEVLDYQRCHRSKRIVTVALAMVFVLCSAGTSLAAGIGTYELYDHLIGYVMEGAEEEAQDPAELPEYEMYLGEMAVAQMEGVEPLAQPSGYIGCTLTNGRWTSGSFRASSGQSIAVSVHGTPSDVYLKVGIIEPDGWMRYVYNCGAISHTFALDQTGTYFVFVTNESNTTVDIMGYYFTGDSSK